MNCPKCGSKYQRVINTRQEGPESTIRQRICKDCAHIFHTVEVDLPYGAVAWKGKSMHRVEGFQHIRFS